MTAPTQALTSTDEDSGTYNVKIDDLMRAFNDGYGTLTTIHASQLVSGQIANTQGDSGGPVEIPTSSGQVYAVSMIQGVDEDFGTGSRDCGAAYDYGPNICGQGVFFTPIHTMSNTISGASLVTG